MKPSDTNPPSPSSPPEGSRKGEIGFGIGAAILAAAFALLVVPAGVVAPDSVEHLPLSPRFLPYLASALIFLFGALHALKAARRPSSNRPAPADESDSRHSNWLLRAAVIGVCLAAYLFLTDYIGMLGVSILVTGSLMFLGGERSPLVLTGSSVLLPVLVFLFFTKIAQIPIPLGLFE